MELKIEDRFADMKLPDPDERRKRIAARVEARAAEDVGDQPVTAELRNWVRDQRSAGLIIWGHIYNDTRGRFPDGRWVHTSAVARIEGDRAITLNSIYKLVGEGK